MRGSQAVAWPQAGSLCFRLGAMSVATRPHLPCPPSSERISFHPRLNSAGQTHSASGPLHIPGTQLN